MNVLLLNFVMFVLACGGVFSIAALALGLMMIWQERSK